ncbi:MAG: ferredoxin [Ignavibacteria bacterium]|nr:ferredoxin [Ignavibacteria bacterium]
MSDIAERDISGLTIKIDRTTCIGTTNCIKVAPDVFILDDENICSFIDSEGDIEKERIIEACSVCPVNALYVLDKEGKQLVP